MSEQHVITAVVKDETGEIKGYMLDDEKVVMKKEAVQMAKSNQISGVDISHSKTGEEYLKSLPDHELSNNLSNLPVISEREL